MNTLLAVDTLDDRREIWHLLHRLPPRERVRFIGRCCNRLGSKGRGVRPSVHRMRDRIDGSYRDDKADEGLTNMLYADLLFLGAQWDLDLPAAVVELESVVRRRIRVCDLSPFSTV